MRKIRQSLKYGLTRAPGEIGRVIHVRDLVGASTCEVQHGKKRRFRDRSPHNSIATTWGRCPQTPGMCRFTPGAWFTRERNGGFSHISLLHLPC